MLKQGPVNINGLFKYNHRGDNLTAKLSYTYTSATGFACLSLSNGIGITQKDYRGIA